VAAPNISKLRGAIKINMAMRSNGVEVTYKPETRQASVRYATTRSILSSHITITDCLDHGKKNYVVAQQFSARGNVSTRREIAIFQAVGKHFR